MQKKTFLSGPRTWSLAFRLPLVDTGVRNTVHFIGHIKSSLWRSEQSTSLYTTANTRDVRGRAPLFLSLSLCHLVALSHAAFITTPRNITTERSETRSGRTTQPAEDVGVATLTLLTGLLFAVFAFRLPSSQRRDL